MELINFIKKKGEVIVGRKRFLIVLFAVLTILMAFTGCAKDETVEINSAEQEGESAIKGNITVLTNRTDIVDTVFEDYAKKFNEKYPHVKISFESFTDYPGEVKIRMNTKDYGDVLLIPNDVPLQDLPDFFEPLGSVAELSEKYLFVDEKAYNQVVYGIPVTINTHGILYNKRVFADAGITELPKTPQEYIDAMRKIKENTDAIPYYTNYAAGWTMDQWEEHKTAVAGTPDYVNSLPHIDDPFSSGRPHYIVYRLMYDLVKEGLVEKDPMTTDWESSKIGLAKGEIASMVLGSWSIVQVQEKAENPEDIGYMPFPYNIDGKRYASSGGDYKIAVSKNSENKRAARAWLDWFLSESNFALDQGGISPVIGHEYPSTLKAFKESGVEFIKNNPPPAGEEGLVDAIDQEGEIGFMVPDFKRRIIEAALGNRDETFDDIMEDLNSRWKEARAKVMK